MEPLVNYSVSLLFVYLFLVSSAGAEAVNISEGLPSPAQIPQQPYTITLFIPSPNMIHSDQIMDQINTPDGSVLFATSFGLSRYNGTWSTRHANLENISAGVMDDFITAIEYDRDGNLWIGYSGGIQVFNGIYYKTIRDQQLLKDPRILDLQRWHDDIWIATGNSGIHRYRNGDWTWFQPMSPGGPGFYEISSMKLDPAHDELVIATANEGIWIVRSPNDPVHFDQVTPNDGTFGYLEGVRRDPLGGVYLLNDTTVVHYSPEEGFRRILTVKDLSTAELSINDLTASPDGKLYLATDDGIYIWANGRISRTLNRFEGIGTSKIVRTITADADNRIWFATQGYVGFYQENRAVQTPIPITLVTPQQDVSTRSLQSTTPPETSTPPVTLQQGTVNASGSSQQGLAPILDPIIRAINAILAKIGLHPSS